MKKLLTQRAIGLASALCSALTVVLFALPATSSAIETCPNAAFRTGLSASLPDCRAYELVTPAEKNGGLIMQKLLVGGRDGESLLLGNQSSLSKETEDNAGFFEGANYLMSRTGSGDSGWTTKAVNPPASKYSIAYEGNGKEVMGEGFATGSTLWLEHGYSQPENRIDFYIEPSPHAPLVDVGPATPPSTPLGEEPGSIIREEIGFRMDGFSQDLSHVLFSVNAYSNSVEQQEAGSFLWPFDSTEPGNQDLYEYVGTGNTAPLLVGVDDSGQLVSRCGTSLAGTNKGSEYEGEIPFNAVSADGSTVFFEATRGKGCAGTNELFVRIDNGQAGAHTLAISEPSSEDCAACDTSVKVRSAPLFMGASEDGSKAFFTSTQPLLGSDTSQNIYEYDRAAAQRQKVLKVSGGDSTVSNPTANVQGVVQTSEDGSHVYFVATGVLTTNAGAATDPKTGVPEHAVAGENNLYVFDTATRETKLVGVLSGGDSGLWKAFRGTRGADTTPDGRFLVFESLADLTLGDTSTAGQVFEYDAQTGTLVRVSVGQEGYNDNGNTSVGGASIVSPTYTSGEGSNPNTYWGQMTVSADGSYVFFQSSDGLTPHAINDPGGPLSNIYEYHNGSVYLISDGQETATAEGGGRSVSSLLGTDVSGRDVFFSTVDQLVPQDTDTSEDFYDARIGGGYRPPASGAPECSGDACQGQLSGAPVLLSPGSQFQAAGGTVKLTSSTVPRRPKAKAKKGKRRKAKPRNRKPKKSVRRSVGHSRKGSK